MNSCSTRPSPSKYDKKMYSSGFTLVEAMIVVVLVGLLAAIAIPAFAKVRSMSQERMLLNDARQVAAAAQQYVTEFNGVVVVAISVDTATGAISGPIQEHLRAISRGSTVSDYNSIAPPGVAAFTMSNPQVENGTLWEFDLDGKKF